MPSGPFGFPRITGLGPLSSDIDDFESETKSGPLTDLDDGGSNVLPVLDKEGLLESPILVRRFFTDNRGIAAPDDYETFGTAIGRYTYVYSESSKTAVIAEINVNRVIREYGIGTEMMKQIHRDLRSIGITAVWGPVTSDEGKRLLNRLGYSQPAPHFVSRDDVYFRTLDPA